MEGITGLMDLFGTILVTTPIVLLSICLPLFLFIHYVIPALIERFG